MQKNKKISFLLTFYNEEEQIFHTFQALEKEIFRLKEKQYFSSYEIVFVDDGSSDKTWDCMQQLVNTKKNLVVLQLSRNFGKEAALCAGLEAVSGEAVISLDGDLQHPLSLLEPMLQKWQEGYEIVEGVKKARSKESFLHTFLAHSYNKLFDRWSGMSMGEASDFKLLDRKVIEAWKELGERQSFFRGMVSWLGFHKMQLPFEVAERKHGVSKWNAIKLARFALETLTSYSNSPLFWSFGFTTFFALATLISLFYALLKAETLYFFVGLFLSLGTSLLFVLSIASFYLSKIFEEIKARPRYLLTQKIASKKENENI